MTKRNKSQSTIDRIINHQQMRIEAARKSHFLFFHMYLSEHVGYQTAPFQEEIFKLTQNEKQKFVVICSFRGSAKSTIMSLSYPLWSIMGQQQKKHVVITSRTQTMAKRILDNLKRELTENKLLKDDLGPFRSIGGKWGGDSIELTNHKARITVVSVEEGVRGIRHGRHRPDLIIADDIEDLISVNTQEGRNKTAEWFNGDLVPAGDKHTRYIVIGNLLHSDSAIMRLRQEIESGDRSGVFKFYPLLDDDGNCLWPGKYPTPADIEAEKKKVADEIAWSREYLLKIISSAERVIHPEWIQLWSNDIPLDFRNKDFHYIGMAVDLAVSTKDQADKTAIVTGAVFGGGENLKIYILSEPEIVNTKLDFPSVMNKIITIYHYWHGKGYSVNLWVESNGFQKGMAQFLNDRGVQAIQVNHSGDKRIRIASAGPAIQRGMVLFPEGHEKEMVNQLIGYGRERYDDLADAVSMLIEQVQASNVFDYDPIAIKGSIYDRTDSRKRSLRHHLDTDDPLGWHYIE